MIFPEYYLYTFIHRIHIKTYQYLNIKLFPNQYQLTMDQYIRWVLHFIFSSFRAITNKLYWVLERWINLNLCEGWQVMDFVWRFTSPTPGFINYLENSAAQSIGLSLPAPTLYIHAYIYIYMYMCTYVYIFICICASMTRYLFMIYV